MGRQKFRILGEMLPLNSSLQGTVKRVCLLSEDPVFPLQILISESSGLEQEPMSF